MHRTMRQRAEGRGRSAADLRLAGLKSSNATLARVLILSLLLLAFSQRAVAQQEAEAVSSLLDASRKAADPQQAGCHVDLEARMVFTSIHWKGFRVQSGHKTMSCYPVDAIRENVMTFEAGDLVRLKGSIQTDPERIVVSDVSLVEKGSLSDLNEQEAFEGDEVRLWRYVRFCGTVAEVYSRGIVTRITFADRSFGVEANMMGVLPRSRQSELIGRKVCVRGLLLPNQENFASDYCVRVMSMSTDQLTEIERGDPPDTELQTIDGRVVEVGEDYLIAGRARISTHTAYLLQVGNNVSMQVSNWDPRSRSGQLRWLHDRGVGEDSADVANDVASASVPIGDQQVYSTVVVTGVVTDTFFEQDATQIYLDHIESGAADQTIVVNVPAGAGQRIRSLDAGTMVRVSGVLHQAQNLDPPADYRLSVRDVDSFEIVSYPLETYINRFKTTIGFAVLSLLLVIIWHYSLSRQVKQKTASLRSLMSQSTAAMQAVSHGILVVDNAECVRLSNANMQALFGDEIEAISKNCESLRGVLVQRFAQRQEFTAFWREANQNHAITAAREFRTTAPDGWLAVYTAPVLDHFQGYAGRIWTFDDISRRRRLQEDHLQSQKISAIGRLAGGVAHDFNNLLQVIGASLDIVSLRETQKDNRQCLETASTAVDRAAELTRQLLTYSRRSQLELQSCNVNDIVHEVSKLMQRVLDARIHFSAVLDPHIAQCHVDPGQLEQVLLNLCINARDAVKSAGGHIRVSSYSTLHPDLGEAVVISVEDDGVGMADDVVQNIYEPFFTTKTVGEGTGLGLAMAVSVVEQVGGRIQCDTREGEGTKFEIVLKATSTAALCPNSTEPIPPVASVSTRRILMVDDDALVLRSGRTLLEGLGHDVECVSSGGGAIEVLRQDADFDLIMLDFMMPLMSGQETLQHIRELAINIPVFICSGYAEQAQAMSEAQLFRPDGFISKPFGAAEVNQFLAGIEPADARLLH